MDAFESIVAMFLEKRGYWVQKSVKIKLTPAEKASIGGRSMPTPEIDLVAYRPEQGLVLIEVKSFLDSLGVTYYDLSGQGKYKARYKLLNNDPYRKMVASRVLSDFSSRGLIPIGTSVFFALAAGKIAPGDETKVETFLKSKNDLYFSPAEISQEIRDLGKSVYVNDTATLTVKLLRGHLN